MKQIPDNIRTFLKKNRVASVCFSNEINIPWCFSCFFVFAEDSGVLVFKSSNGSSHQDYTENESNVCGTVLQEQLDVIKIKGMQFSGRTIDSKTIDPKLSTLYYKQYPFGRVVTGYIWAIKLDFIKFTDKTLTFNQQTVWKSSLAGKEG